MMTADGGQSSHMAQVVVFGMRIDEGAVYADASSVGGRTGAANPDTTFGEVVDGTEDPV